MSAPECPCCSHYVAILDDIAQILGHPTSNVPDCPSVPDPGGPVYVAEGSVRVPLGTGNRFVGDVPAGIDHSKGWTVEGFFDVDLTNGWSAMLEVISTGDRVVLRGRSASLKQRFYVNGSAVGTIASVGTLLAWGKLTVTYDGAVLRAYWNGVQVIAYTVVLSGDLTSITGLGLQSGTAAGSTSGCIADLRVIPRALSAAEVAAGSYGDGPGGEDAVFYPFLASDTIPGTDGVYDLVGSEYSGDCIGACTFEPANQP